jgi:hypothetical protein
MYCSQSNENMQHKRLFFIFYKVFCSPPPPLPPNPLILEPVTSLGMLVPCTWGTQWRSWLRHCATRRNVTGLIPDGVIGIFRSHYGPGVDSASNRNEYQESFLGGGGKGGQCVGLTALPPSCADCLEIWEPQPSGTLRVCPGL